MPIGRKGKSEREARKLLSENNLVSRAAGSMGPAGDLIVIHKDKPAYILEVKSTKSDEVNLKQNHDWWTQYQHMKELSLDGYDVYYMVRWIGHRDLFGSDDRDKFSFYEPTRPVDYPHILRKGQHEIDLWSDLDE